MKKLTFEQVEHICIEHNQKYNVQNQFGDKEPLYFIAVLDNKYLKRYYTLEYRKYIFTSDNKAFISRMIGYSIFAECKADNDYCRIENMHILYYYQCDKQGNAL